MCAFYYSEGDKLSKSVIEETERHGLNLIQSYPEANYFQSQIEQTFGVVPTLFNFTTAACMPSDARLLLNRIASRKRESRVLIYGLGLRDFVDNINPPPGETPAFRALCDAPYLAENVQLVPKQETRTWLALSSLSQVYRLKDQFRLCVESLLCKELKRQTNMEHAFSLIAMEREQKAKNAATSIASAAAMLPKEKVHAKTGVKHNETSSRSKSTANAAPAAESNLAVLDYPTRYNPPNYKKLEQEMQELERIVDLCKQKQIELVLVNMPVSDGNKTLSAPGLREEYLKRLKTLCQKDSVALIDFENRKIFGVGDFLDTVHLSGYGAKKMIDELLAQLEQQGLSSKVFGPISNQSAKASGNKELK